MAKFAKKIGTLEQLGHKYDKKYLYFVKSGVIYISPRAVGGKVDDKTKPSKATPMDERREMNGVKKRTTKAKSTRKLK